MAKRKLLTNGASSPKLSKQGRGIEAVILHLASGRKVCPWASEGCLKACLVTAGRGAMTMVQEARQRKQDAFFADRVSFLDDLDRELANLARRAHRKGWAPVARLNGTSDIPWEKLGVFARNPAVQFYDYTKSQERARQWSDGVMPSNYHLTLSRTETWDDGEVLYHTAVWGVNVAVVFDTPKGQPLPRLFEGVQVIDGRTDDWRFKDPRGVVVGLSALGKGRKDTSGFVVKA